MISNESDLQSVRDQIRRVENTLAKLRLSVEPQSPQRFALMAESYLDTLAELRSQVDAYVGANLAAESNSPLVITLKGDGIRLGSVGGSVITRTIDNFRKGIASVVDALAHQAGDNVGGRHQKWIEDITDFPFKLAPGSVRIIFGDPSTGEMFEGEQLEELKRALQLIVQGAEWASTDSTDGFADGQMTEETRQAVLNTLRRLAPAQGSQIDHVVLSGKFSAGPSDAVLSKSTRIKIQRELKRANPDPQFISVVGSVREVDLDSREFRLTSHDDKTFECTFDAGLEADIAVMLGGMVMVEGTQVLTKGRDSRVNVEFVVQLDDSGSDDGPLETPGT